MAAKVLIIGGTRFLGRTIEEAFVNKGYDVYLMNRGSKPLLKGIIEQIRCGKSDREVFAEVIRRHSWDVIVDTILNDKDLEFVVETLGDNVGQFIHTSSLGVYGEARRIPAKESIPLQEYEGEDIVFNYKIKQDQIILKAINKNGFPGTILRMSYIYGPGDIPLDGWGGRSPQFFKLLRDSENILLPSNGRALIHPGHVKDLGRSFLRAAENPQTSIGQIYNIAGHYAIMMKDYISMIADALGVKSNFEFAPISEVLSCYPEITNERGMKFSCQHMCGSIAKAARDLDWQPEIPLEIGVRKNIEWMKQQNII